MSDRSRARGWRDVRRDAPMELDLGLGPRQGDRTFEGCRIMVPRSITPPATPSSWRSTRLRRMITAMLCQWHRRRTLRSAPHRESSPRIAAASCTFSTAGAGRHPAALTSATPTSPRAAYGLHSRRPFAAKVSPSRSPASGAPNPAMTNAPPTARAGVRRAFEPSRHAVHAPDRPSRPLTAGGVLETR